MRGRERALNVPEDLDLSSPLLSRSGVGSPVRDDGSMCLTFFPTGLSTGAFVPYLPIRDALAPRPCLPCLLINRQTYFVCLLPP